MSVDGSLSKFVGRDQMSNGLDASEAFHRTVIGWGICARHRNGLGGTRR
jgi:hypothetical protein